MDAAAPKTLAEAMRERGIAWSKYYRAAEFIEMLNARIDRRQRNIIRDFVKMFMKDEITAKAMTAIYKNHDIRCEIYSKFGSGAKTIKDIYYKTNKAGDVIGEEDYHFAAGKPYKPWKAGDEPDYYMETIRITDPDICAIEPTTGLWCVKPEIMKTMGATHRKGVLAQMLAFARPLFEDETEKITDISFNGATSSYTFTFA